MVSRVDRLARALSPGTPGPKPMTPARTFIGKVTAVDGTAKTATVAGVAYKYVETPTAIIVDDMVLVQRIGIGQGIILGRMP